MVSSQLALNPNLCVAKMVVKHAEVESLTKQVNYNYGYQTILNAVWCTVGWPARHRFMHPRGAKDSATKRCESVPLPLIRWLAHRCGKARIGNGMLVLHGAAQSVTKRHFPLANEPALDTLELTEQCVLRSAACETEFTSEIFKGNPRWTASCIARPNLQEFLACRNVCCTSSFLPSS
jgi:hypothetical protein